MSEARGTIFVAGASGAIGRRLCPLLVADGWRVVGTTRSAEKALLLHGLGVEPEIVDVYDAARLIGLVAQAKPSVVIHQLTDLPRGLDPSQLEEARARNARIREVGTRNLVAAAAAAGAERLVAQSITFASPGSVTARGVASLEEQVLAAPLEGVVLRYGRLYGPGTGVNSAPSGGPVHVDAAADAARRAATRGAPGIYNIAEDDGTVDSTKAREALGWRPEFRRESK